MSEKLTLDLFLRAVSIMGIDTRESLLMAGFPQKRITYLAEKAATKGLYDYGVVADRGWLTDAGRARVAVYVSHDLERGI